MGSITKVIIKIMVSRDSFCLRDAVQKFFTSSSRIEDASAASFLPDRLIV
jgi:hypothetical protein